MRPFSELTMRGRGLRLRGLAADVVEHEHGLADSKIRLVSMHSFNSIFRVDVDGERFALRIGDSCRIHLSGVEAVEAEWLASMNEAGIAVAQNVPTTTGEPWVERSFDGVPGARVCTLFTWLDGRPLATTVDTQRMQRAGELLATLHDHATSFEPTLVPSALRADRAVYFHEKNLVRSYESVRGSLFVEAIERVQAEIDALWATRPHRPHLLHGDFGPHNVLVNRSRFQPIDFQDLQLGFDVQDVAITVADLSRNRPEAIGPFRDGYTNVRSWPDLSATQEATFAAARSLNVMNLALVAPSSGIARSFDAHAARVVEWMGV